jgi:chorismate synthase
MTTWGESHGEAIGVVIDGCPAGLPLERSDIDSELARRRPGYSPHTSPRKELDQVQILSGVFDGHTTGAPISLLIENQDVDSTKYDAIKGLLRPGHANFTYLAKYGFFDHRGGGRSSARETACRVAAGAIAKKLLAREGIEVLAYLQQMASLEVKLQHGTFAEIASDSRKNALFCPDAALSLEMQHLIDAAKREGDSLGGVVAFLVEGMPKGLGDPVYEKLEARLAYAMMGLPATKAFEIGSGFDGCLMRGSEHNDIFEFKEGQVQTKSNFAGGVLGGISTGMPLFGRVGFKPTSSILKEQNTISLSHEKSAFQLPGGSRHDPCVAIRAVPVVEAMLALVLADLLLLNRSARL